MATDLYSDSEEGGPVDSPEYGQEEQKDDMQGTALLPKEFFPDDPQPGKKCSVRVVSVQDDQVEVAYDHSEEASDPTEQAEAATMVAGQGGGQDYMG